ncbi:MAG: calcium-binding protein [Pseudomonadota bacterium]
MQFAISEGRAAVVGGFGAQNLTGGAGDDLIFGDGDGDRRLLALDEDRDAGAGVYLGPAQATGVMYAGAVRFFAAGAETGAGGVGGWTAAGDALSPVWSLSAQFYDTQNLLTGSRAVLAFGWEGSSYLVTGGAGISLSRLDGGGVPELLNSRFAGWGDGLLQPGAFAAFEADGALHLLVGGGWEGGLTVLRWDAFGLRIVTRLADSRETRLAGVSDLEMVELDGTLFALVTAFADGGLGVYQIDGVSPGLADQRHAGDGETGFDLTDATAVEAVRRGDRAYVYAASEDGRLISYALDADGKLTRLEDRSGAHDLAHVRLAGRDWLLSVEGDRKVKVFQVDRDGTLDWVETLQLEAGARAVSLAAVVEGDRARLLVGRDDADGYDLLSFRPEGNDLISGGSGDDEILGGAGEDRLDGGTGNDSLLGEGDDDELIGAGGADRLWGGDGDDRLDGGEGKDALAGDGGDDLLAGGDGDDALSGDGGRDLLQGGGGSDVLDGGDEADRLFGGDGDDVLGGDGADDVLAGGGGADRLSGGAGSDALDGGAGRDELRGQAGRDDLKGGGGGDVLIGGGGNDGLNGGAGADALDGGGGSDVLNGGGGRDAMTGGAGADRLVGGRGADRLNGGPGRDALEGGGGRDVFVFDRRGEDRVLDFGRGDRLDFARARSFDDMRIRDRGDDAQVVFGQIKALLEGVRADDLDASDFIF